jgi:hypothetical protein
MLKKEDNTSLKLDIDKKEISLLKLVFINKVRKKYEKDSKLKMKMLILQLDIINNDFQVFIEDTKGIVTKFEY